MNPINKNLISLDKFINNYLYNKKNGYYMNKNPFGKNGDFTTSPNISILFSEMITIWLISFWEDQKKPKKINIVELGAGNGEMMLQILKTLNNFPQFKKSCKFYIFEKSPFLKKIQKKKLKKFKVDWINNFKILDSELTLFLGNEFLDSFPIKQFVKKKNQWYEKYIDLSSKKNFVIEKKINIEKYEKKIGIAISKKQKFIEFSPAAMNTINQISKVVNKYNGGILLIDYGYLEDQMKNTLQVVKNHKKVEFSNLIKNSDITYLINYSLLKKIFEKFNLKLNGMISQGKFLVNLGILNRAENISKSLKFSEKANVYFRLKRLIDKKEMGDLFKVSFFSNKKINFKLGFDD